MSKTSRKRRTVPLTKTCALNTHMQGGENSAAAEQPHSRSVGVRGDFCVWSIDPVRIAIRTYSSSEKG